MTRTAEQASTEGAGRKPSDSSDPKQDIVVKAGPSERLLVVAGPGTGKTHVSALRLAHLIRSGVRPSEVLVLSFSRSAVKTLAGRIATFACAGDAMLEELRHLSIRTFDSWAFRFLRQMGAQPRDLLSVSHDQNIQAVINLFTGPERERARELLSRVRHVIIDEFQDLPGVRGKLVLALFDLLAPVGSSEVGFTVLGDVAQAIYGFAARNATTSGVASTDSWEILRERYGAGLKEVTLDQNYRAVPELAVLARNIRRILALKITGEEKLAEVRRHIENLPASGELGPHWVDSVPEGSVAILTRTNGEAMRVAQKLTGQAVEAPGVPVRLQVAGHVPPVPGWIAALLGPLRSETLPNSRFLQIHAQCSASLKIEGQHIIGLPDAGTAWLRLVRACGTSDSAMSIDMGILRQRLNWPDSFPDDTASHDAGIFISTVHQAKGMEFDSVAILESEPAKEGELSEYPDEEASVGFVAITRAGQQLGRIPLGNIYRAPGIRECAGSRNRLCHWWGGWVNFEMGIPGDIDPLGFVDDCIHGTSAAVADVQALLLRDATVLRGHKIMLAKTFVEGDFKKAIYNIHLQEGSKPGRLLGRTSTQLTIDLLGLLWDHGYSLPSRIMNLRIADIVTVCGPEEAGASVSEQYRSSRLWLGVTLVGTGDFKPVKRKTA